MRRIHLALMAVLLALPDAAADEADVRGGAMLFHCPTSISFSTDPPPDGWCEEYWSTGPLTACEDQVAEIAEAGPAVWFVLMAWSEPKRVCAVEFGFDDYPPGLFTFHTADPCFPSQGLQFTHGAWPGPHSGVSLAVTDSAWVGRIQPVYAFSGYAYGYGTIGLGPSHPGGSIRACNCASPTVSEDILNLGRLGLLVPGETACPAPPPSEVDLYDPGCAFDYVILSADALMGEAERLLLHRSALGLRACLIPLSTIRAAFGPGDDAELCRAFCAFAYEHWRIAPLYLTLVGDAAVTLPEYNILPARVRPNPRSVEYGGEYVDEGHFVSFSTSSDVLPMLHVGRIPARTAAQLAAYLDKLIAYESAGVESWHSRALMLTGNANINGDWGYYGSMQQRLENDVYSDWADMRRVLAADYGTTASATDATRSFWNLGAGLVSALGQTQDWDILVQCSDFSLPPAPGPTFTESLDPSGQVPIVLAGTCLVNFFYRGYERCVAEDLLFASSARGAIGVIGASHVIDGVDAYKAVKALGHALTTDDIRQAGRLLTAAKVRMLRERNVDDSSIRQLCLLGDAALQLQVPRVGSHPGMQLDMEVDGVPVAQDRMAECSSGIAGAWSRLCHGKYDASPPAGERCMFFEGEDSPGERDFVEWRLCDWSGQIQANTILAFWINCVETPSSVGRVSLDASTTRGMLREHVDVQDQYGMPLNARLRASAVQGWELVYADLTGLAGAALSDLRLRYEANDAIESGTLRVLLDDVIVRLTDDLGASEILNGSFEESQKGRFTPLFWTDVVGAADREDVCQSNTDPMEGDYCCSIIDKTGCGNGAQQIVHLFDLFGTYELQLWHRSLSRGAFGLRCVDLESGQVIGEWNVESGPEWAECQVLFSLSWRPETPARIAIQMIPRSSQMALFVDNVSLGLGASVATPMPSTGQPGATQDARWNGVQPSVWSQGSPLRLMFRLGSTAEVRVALRDVAGRTALAVDYGPLHAGDHELQMAVGSSARLASGLYFVDLYVEGERLGGSRRVVVW